MSASPTPSATPARASARLTATVDLPTPPFALDTAITCRTPGSGARPANGSRPRPTAASATTTRTSFTPATRPTTSSMRRARAARTSALSVPGRSSTVTVPPSTSTPETMPSVTTSRRKPGKSTARSASRTRSGVTSAMRATVAAGSAKGNARDLDFGAIIQLSPVVSGEIVAQRGASAPLPAIPAAVQEDLARVEERLAAELTSREARLEEVVAHLVRAGGKRIRPLVVLLVFHATVVPGRARRDDAVEAAVALELIHSATLLHDDIIDGGETRRGRPSALQRFGVADTLVAGDFLFCRAFAICARFEAEVVRWAAEACVSLTEGEVLQGRHRRDPAVRIADSDEIILRKTASLFAAGARTAAHLAA